VQPTTISPHGELFFNQISDRPAGHRYRCSEPLVEIPPEIREEWIETLDRAIEAMGTVGVGLAQAMNTLKELESETSDFPLNLPDLGQPVLNSATEHDQ
jgi:hypothetical protein